MICRSGFTSADVVSLKKTTSFEPYQLRFLTCRCLSNISVNEAYRSHKGCKNLKKAQTDLCGLDKIVLLIVFLVLIIR